MVLDVGLELLRVNIESFQLFIAECDFFGILILILRDLGVEQTYCRIPLYFLSIVEAAGGLAHAIEIAGSRFESCEELLQVSLPLALFYDFEVSVILRNCVISDVCLINSVVSPSVVIVEFDIVFSPPR